MAFNFTPFSTFLVIFNDASYCPDMAEKMLKRNIIESLYVMASHLWLERYSLSAVIE